MKYACVVKCDGTGSNKQTGTGVAAAVVGVVRFDPRDFDFDLLDASWSILSAQAEVYKNLTVPQLEYSAILLGLKSCKPTLLLADLLVVYSDSQLVVNHINGVYTCRHPNLRPYLAQVFSDVESIKSKYNTEPRIVWVRREFNRAADNVAACVRRLALEEEKCSPELSTTTK